MDLTNINDLKEYKRRIYIRIGLFIQEWQRLEYIFAYITSIVRSDKEGNIDDIFIELQDRSFGNVIKEFEETKLAPQKMIDALKKLNDYRNGIIHKFFISYTNTKLMDSDLRNELEVLMDRNTKGLTELSDYFYFDILVNKLGFIEGDINNEQV